jgi:hypothetical protein
LGVILGVQIPGQPDCLRYAFDHLADKAGPLSDPMLLGILNRGIISLASTLDTSVAFSMLVGYASTQSVKVQTTSRRYR